MALIFVRRDFLLYFSFVVLVVPIQRTAQIDVDIWCFLNGRNNLQISCKKARDDWQRKKRKESRRNKNCVRVFSCRLRWSRTRTLLHDRAGLPIFVRRVVRSLTRNNTTHTIHVRESSATGHFERRTRNGRRNHRIDSCALHLPPLLAVLALGSFSTLLISACVCWMRSICFQFTLNLAIDRLCFWVCCHFGFNECANAEPINEN